MENNPSIFIYGSLLNKNLLKKYFNKKSVSNAEITTLNNHKRIFNSEVTVRDYENKYRSILNCVYDDEYFINGILIKNVNFENFGKYVVREDGYRFNIVNKYITNVHDNIDGKILVPMDAEISNEQIYPHKKYLKECVKSSKQWGDKFHNEFLNNTYLMNNINLNKYIN